MMAYVDTFECVHEEESWTHSVKDLRRGRQRRRSVAEPKFPKKPRAQIKFLAISLAGRPNVEARTSRDIYAKGLAEEKARSPHKILRKEFYVECSCGYKGPASNNACRKCGAQIDLLPELLRGFGLAVV